MVDFYCEGTGSKFPVSVFSSVAWCSVWSSVEIQLWSGTSGVIDPFPEGFHRTDTGSWFCSGYFSSILTQSGARGAQGPCRTRTWSRSGIQVSVRSYLLLPRFVSYLDQLEPDPADFPEADCFGPDWDAPVKPEQHRFIRSKLIYWKRNRFDFDYKTNKKNRHFETQKISRNIRVCFFFLKFYTFELRSFKFF